MWNTVLILSIFTALVLCYGHRKSHNHADNLIVEAPMGKFHGAVLKSRLGKDIFSFRGIRYAQPPVGDLRFKAPVPVTTYEGVYNATVDGDVCPQPPFSVPMSEDCLFLNVYTTQLPKHGNNPKRPVIIHLHAGGFYVGTERSNWGGPQYFMDRDVVLVTMNYRLGSLGFLSTGDMHAIGNNGLRDQVVAMKWVQRNIAAFGGDPHSVTLMGYSAGAWSVILHMVSPMSKGLFHRGVASSGTPIGIFPLPNSQPEIAKKQARILNCPDDTTENIVKCLKTKSAEELGNSLPRFFEFGSNSILQWSPVIEEDYGQERFLPDHPINLINKGEFMDIPLMAGVTEDEFSGQVIQLQQNKTMLRELDENWETLAPICFIYERDTNKSKLVSRNIKDFYLKDTTIDSPNYIESLKKIFADAIVGNNVNRLIKFMSQKLSNSIYYYKFSFQGRYSHIYLPETTTPIGVVHHDDLIYTFYISPLFPYFNITDPEYKMVKQLTTFFENFAKTGNPTPQKSKVLDNITWQPFNDATEMFLDIGNSLMLKEKMFKKRYDFWEQLYPTGQI
ncbi:esterase E4-like [Aethina tumida]|uniref:esterase E4-like n=1 Tax=Aethina tumida TaxID=116153 RepID=UPI002147ABCB|nr:esterase E4-like [Aethina tumida]